jgi:formate hydrogenlyase subunit 3/multisubunit Na+/H+ antiporter MnhD subunit
MSLLLVLSWLIPLVAAAVSGWRGAWWLPSVAALPGLIGSALVGDGVQLELPWLLLGTTLGMDEVTRLFLAFTAVLWLAAGIYAAPMLRDGPHAVRFRVLFLLAMAGNLWLIVGQDLVSFYVGFSLMGLAAYGLVVHDGDPAALRAGRVYLAMAIAGELALFAALVMIARHTGDLTPTRDQLIGLDDLTIGLLIVGLAIKAGLVPLHVWLPLAHPAAPVPASAVLSGAMIKVALLGWLRFLPVGAEALAGWGLLLVFTGLLTLFFAIPIGLVQSNPKVILAYSSVSKMGLLALVFGLLLVDPGLAPAGILAITLYAAHHALVKGALFLGVGLRLHGPLQGLVLAGLALLALSLVGFPPTSGAVAKSGIKPTLAGADWSWLTQAVVYSAAATTLLMARFMWVVWRLPTHPERGYGAGLAAWGALTALSAAYALVLGSRDAWLANPWPVVVGLALAGAVALVAWLRPALLGSLIGRVAPGDLLALVGPLVEVGRFSIQTGARQVRRARRFLISRTGEALTALRSRSGDPETQMSGWPTAGAAWLGILGLLLVLAFALPVVEGPPEAMAPVGPEGLDRAIVGNARPADPALGIEPGLAPQPEPQPKPEQEPQPEPAGPDTLATAARDSDAGGIDRGAAGPTPAALESDGQPLVPPGVATPTPPSAPASGLLGSEPASGQVSVPEYGPESGPEPAPEGGAESAVALAPRDTEGDISPESTESTPDANRPDETPANATPSTAGDPEAATEVGPTPTPTPPQAPGPVDEPVTTAPDVATTPRVCDPQRSFDLDHPRAAATLSLTDCREGPEGPERISAPPLTNDLVRLTQLHLRDLGFDPGPVDGLIGPRTRAALRAFASARGLPPTGEINFRILGALRDGPTPGSGSPGSGEPRGPKP